DVVPIELSGEVSVKGSFDERYLVMFYEGKKVSLEGPSFRLAVDTISNQGEIAAVHYIDLKTWDHVGYLPLKGATHVQKNFDIDVKYIEGLVQCENKSIRINDVKTIWKGLPMDGRLEIQMHSLTDMDLGLQSTIRQGSLS